ncbi:MAG: helix-turn-helix domain-containing protein [Oscillospiraceae bacterium]|nr:helix-turn-helix domain-containing protein [Oscillospiraceae bacterium]
MDKLAVGNLIKSRRKEKKCTQEELCSGICSIASLSRIENGKAGNREKSYIPSLFERLGMSADSLNEIISEDDYSVRQMIRRANQANCFGDREEAWRILAETRTRINNDGHKISLANEQRLLTIETELSRRDGKITVEDEQCRLENALRMTAVNYTPDNLPAYMTNMEHQILGHIAITYYELEQSETAIRIYYHVKNFLETYVDDKMYSAGQLTHLCYNLSKMLGLAGRYDECISVCHDGLDWHKYTGLEETYPLTMYNCAWSLARRNKEGDLEEAKKLAYGSLELANVMSKYIRVSPTLAGHIQKLIDEYLS